LDKREALRRDKIIGSSLEAQVTIEATSDVYNLLKGYESDLQALFISSHVELRLGTTVLPPDDHAVIVSKATGAKCERCWSDRASVGSFPDHPTLCDRCIEAVR
jgi:isoleucyl-tRNA synthetase